MRRHLPMVVAYHRRALWIAPTLLLLALAALHGATSAQQGAADRIVGACGGSNPYLVTTRFAGDLSAARAAREPAVFAFRDTPGDDLTEQIVLATQAQVGAVYGLAYDATRRQLYAAAYHKRGAPFGPGGPGAVYRIDLEAGAVATWATLPGGLDRHARPLGDDGAGAAWVGRTGLADIELDDSASTLFVADLSDRRMYRLSVPDGAILGNFAFGAAGADWVRDARLFALAYRDGWLYHGVMDTRSSTRRRGPLPTGHVYQSRPDGSEMREVAVFDVPNAGAASGYPWDSTRVPILTDIEFRSNGDMVLGIRNRNLDETIGQFYVVPAGDTLPGVLAGDHWDVITTPERYVDTNGGPDETTTGALAAMPGLDQVVSTALGYLRPRSFPGPLGQVSGARAGARLFSTGALEAPAGRWRWPAALVRSAEGTDSPPAPVAQPAQATPYYRLEAISALWFDNESGRQARHEALLLLDYPVDDRTPFGAGDVEALCRRDQALDPNRLATETRQAGEIATATRDAAATRILATHTMAAATGEARGTAAAATATAQAQTGTPTGATPPGPGPAPTLTAVSAQLTADLPTRQAMATEAATADVVPAATQAAAATAYDRIKASCGSDNPYLAIACFVPGLVSQRSPRVTETPAPYEIAPVVEAFNDSDPETFVDHLGLAYQPQAGALFGLAYDWRRGQLYASAYHKTAASFGPLGPGAIYRIDLATGAVRPWAWLDAGPDRHDWSGGADAAAAPYVGKVGIGDIELDDSGRTLFAVNLYDRLIYRLSVPDGRIVGLFPHGAAGEPWADSARPFGLGVRDGWLYHGIVDERDRTEGSANGLWAYIYRSRFDGSEMTEVARFDLGYGRAMPWQAWSDKIAVGAMLTDIEFRPNGDLIVGLRDRLGDGLISVGDGDILPTIRVGDRWFVWSEPEFYPDQIVHDESPWGGLASLPGLDMVVASMLDPWQANSGGAIWYDNLSGDMARRETLYGAGTNYPTFSKSAGLGDVEVLCPAFSPTPPPTLTPTPSVTPSLTPSSTPTSTATPTLRPRPIYLPLALTESCAKRQVYADVVLVIDVSTSMRRPAGDGRPKLDAVQSAARAFVDQMSLGAGADGRHDQVAIVGFNDWEWIEQELTGDRAALGAAIDHLPQRMAEGTRLDLAIAGGIVALSGPTRRAYNTAVIVLLTDGMPNRVPTPAPAGSQEDSVLLVASAAKAHGIRIYTVGVGLPNTPDLSDRINPDLLRGVASAPRMYYQTWSAAELAAIYREIAYTIGCPPEGFWGRR